MFDEIISFPSLNRTEEETINETISCFGSKYPKASVMSKVARDSVSGTSMTDDPDNAIYQFMVREEQLFEALEQRIEAPRIRNFSTVNEMAAHNLTITNRRKSRAGRALENHTLAILEANSISFAYQVLTEKSRPDFIFPSEAAYRDPNFDPNFLDVLASKRSLIDRWRQPLAEAARVSIKHIITCDTKITSNMLDEMESHNVRLIIPLPYQDAIKPLYRSRLMSVEDFITYRRKRTIDSGMFSANVCRL